MQNNGLRAGEQWTLNASATTSAGRVACGIAGDGPSLVLAHGWPWSSFSWHRIIPALSEHFRVHWYDMPGFGGSELAPVRAPSLGVQGEVFSEMLAHWQLDTPLVVAHDFGGTVALRSHLLHGQDFAGLVLMNVVAMRPWGSAFFEHVKAHVPAFTGLPAHIHAAIVRAYIDSALVHALAAADVEHLALPWTSPKGQKAFWRQFELADEIFTAEIEPQFGALRCPTAILWGADDPWIPIARGEALAERVGVELTRLPGVGHLPQLEAPDVVLREVLAHFARSLSGLTRTLRRDLTVMGNENTDRVRAYIAAYNRFDIDEMIAQLHPDVTFRNYAKGALTHETKGLTAFRAQAEAAATLFSARHQAIRALDAGAECITVEIDYKGVLAIDLPDGPRAGDVIELVGTSEYVFNDGRIISIVDRS